MSDNHDCGFTMFCDIIKVKMFAGTQKMYSCMVEIFQVTNELFASCHLLFETRAKAEKSDTVECPKIL